MKNKNTAWAYCSVWCCFCFVVCFIGSSAYASDDKKVLQHLLQQAQQVSHASQQDDEKRLAHFQQQQHSQRQLLEEAQAQLTALEALSQRLNAQYTQNRETIRQLQDGLQKEKNTYNQLFAVIRHHGQDLQQTVSNSLLSPLASGWLPSLSQVTQAEAVLTEQHVRTLWQGYLQWLLLSSQISHHTLPIILPDGEEKEVKVALYGPFNASYDSHWLHYLPDSQRFMLMQPQPNLEYFAQPIHKKAENGVTAVLIDHRGGALMKQLAMHPNWQTQLKAGGIIGALILILGVIGIGLVVYRFMILRRINITISKQAEEEQKSLQKALTGVNAELIELSLTERLQLKLAGLNKGMVFIATLATVAPLLGLLGTVVGMIDTFQMLMLYGNSDPKILSSGISKALVTTELGLIVAVPLILCHSQLGGMIQKMQQRYEQQFTAINVALLAK